MTNANNPHGSAPLAVRASSAINVMHHDPVEITRTLQRAAEQFNLVTPATACGELSPGFEVSFTSVLVPWDDTYDQSGKRGLSRVSIDRIAIAAGITWIVSQRLDNGRIQDFCAWQVIGEYQAFDGSDKKIIGTKQMDLREGSRQIEGMSPKELAMQRKHIVAHAETKARLRAVASLGVKRSYTPEDIAKPFVVARLMFTGRTDDPELRRDFARMKAIAAIGGRAALYGALAPTQAPAPAQLPQVGSGTIAGSMAPPPVGSVDDDEDVVEVSGSVACTYCGSFDDVSHVSTPRGTIPVCGDQACYERASTGVSVQASQVDPPAKTPSQPPPAQPRPNDPRTPASSPAYPSASTSPTPPGASRPAAPAPPSPPQGGRAAGPAARNEAVRPSGFTIPGGRSRGQAIEDAEGDDVRYWLKRRMDDLQSDPNGRFADTNRKWIDAARLELDRRDGIPY